MLFNTDSCRQILVLQNDKVRSCCRGSLQVSGFVDQLLVLEWGSCLLLSVIRFRVFCDQEVCLWVFDKNIIFHHTLQIGDE